MSQSIHIKLHITKLSVHLSVLYAKHSFQARGLKLCMWLLEVISCVIGYMRPASWGSEAVNSYLGCQKTINESILWNLFSSYLSKWKVKKWWDCPTVSFYFQGTHGNNQQQDFIVWLYFTATYQLHHNTVFLGAKQWSVWYRHCQQSLSFHWWLSYSFERHLQVVSCMSIGAKFRGLVERHRIHIPQDMSSRCTSTW